MGLHIGIELTAPGASLVARGPGAGPGDQLHRGNVIRIMPPLNITLKTAREGMKILERLFIEEGGKQ